MTKKHKLMTENGWSNNFIDNKYIMIKNKIKKKYFNILSESFAYIYGSSIINDNYYYYDNNNYKFNNKENKVIKKMKYKISKIIMKSNLINIKLFLQGVFDNEGIIKNKKIIINIYSEIIANQLKYLLEYFEIKSNIINTKIIRYL